MFHVTIMRADSSFFNDMTKERGQLFLSFGVSGLLPAFASTPQTQVQTDRERVKVVLPFDMWLLLDISHIMVAL